MRILKIFVTILVLSITSLNIKAQDSLRVQDPQPVVITQDGYSQEASQEGILLSEMSFTQRLKYGGSLGPFQFSNFQSIIGLSPMVGYRLTNSTIVGVGLSMIFWRIKIPTQPKEKQDLVGYSGFIRQDIKFTEKLGFPLYATLEAVQFQGIQTNDKYRAGFLVGLGMGRADGYGLQALYDLNYNYNTSFSGSFNNSPLVIRVTGFF